MGARIFRALLRFLPGDFRSEFGDAMHADANAAGARWWTREIPGLIAAVVREQAAGMTRDLTDTWGLLRRTPGFTAAAILMLGLGTGATAAIFSVVDAVVLRPAFPDADRIVSITELRDSGAAARSLTVEQFREMSARAEFAGVSGMTGTISYVDRGSSVDRVDVECVSHTLFPILGVRPMIGRAFDASDDRAGAPPVVVIGERMWRRDFGASASAIGTTMSIGHGQATIIGVMSAEFLGPVPNNHNEAWAPLEPALAGQRDALCGPAKRLEVVAHLRQPMAAASAAAITEGGSRFGLARVDAASLDGYGAPLIALMATAACVLLIACANVANLQLERLAGRRHEVAVRMALGAGRWRIVRQSIVENLALSAAGGAAGILIAKTTLGFLVRMAPPQLPHVGEIAVNGRALGVAIATALACGFAISLVPLVQIGKITGGLRTSDRTVKGGGLWVRRTLVAGEVALSAALVVAATLMARSFVALGPDDLGFNPANRIVAATSVDDDALPQSARAAFAAKVTNQLRELPGVRSAGASSYMPLLGYTESRPVVANARTVTTWTGWLTPSFLDTLGGHLAHGRQFTEADSSDAAPVAIVNTTFAKSFFGAEPAVGRVVSVTQGRTVIERRIVGVIDDMREGGRDRIQRPELYAPFTQQPDVYQMYFVVETTGATPPGFEDRIRAVVKNARAGQLLYRLEPMGDIVARGFARARFGVWLFGVLAVLAVVLAGLGLAAVIAWWVRERRAEIGLCIALGATTTHVARRVVGESVLVAAAGAAIGLSGAFLSARLLTDWLFAVTPRDPVTFAIGGSVMLAIAAAAAFFPARHAARIDPATTLRAE